MNQRVIALLVASIVCVFLFAFVVMPHETIKLTEVPAQYLVRG